MDKNDLNREYDLASMDYLTRQMEATVHLTEFLYGLLIQYRQQGIDVYSISYLLNLTCSYLMKVYGGDKTVIEQIQAEAKKECDKYCQENKNQVTGKEVDEVTRQLQGMGINFKVTYDPKTKKTSPNVNPINLPPEMLDKWMRDHMDEVLDAYIKRQKKNKDGDKNDDLPKL